MACPPSITSISCNTPTTFNITASGYVGSNPTSGQSGCNPCCYSGADLDCDGVQDVPFSVENSKWYQYCNTTGSSITITITVDEPGTGSSCNVQGACWVGSSFNSTVIGCNNSMYNYYDSNPGGAADGFTFGSIVVPNGQCAYVMADGYGGSTCSGLSVTINCPVPLPIELVEFRGEPHGMTNMLYWTTATETNNDYFVVSRSADGVDFDTVSIVDGNGTTSDYTHYSTADGSFVRGHINYYRLTQYDFNGQNESSNIIAIDNADPKSKKVVRRLNTLGQDVPADYEGIYIEIYDDGTTSRKCCTPR